MAGLINSVATNPDGTPKINVAKFDPATTAPAATATTTQSTATGYGATRWKVDPSSTVSGQLKGILASDSPLNTQAETYAKQQMNSRGLINSSMAVGAAQDAVIKNALPIATQDASTNARAGEVNAGADNAAAAFTANAKNQSSLNNAQLGTNVSLANAASTNQTNQFNANAINQTRQANAGAENQASLAGAQIASQQATQSAQNDTQLKLQQIQSDTSLSVADKNAASAQLIAGNDNTTKLAIQNLQAASQAANIKLTAEGQMAIAMLDKSTQEKLATMGEQSKQLIQANAVLANMYSQTVTNLTNIAMNKDMNADAKATATTNQLELLREGMAAATDIASTAPQAISSLDLSQYFNEQTEAAQAVTNANAVATDGIYTAPDGSMWQNKAAYDARPQPYITPQGQYFANKSAYDVWLRSQYYG